MLLNALFHKHAPCIESLHLREFWDVYDRNDHIPYWTHWSHCDVHKHQSTSSETQVKEEEQLKDTSPQSVISDSRRSQLIVTIRE